MKHVDGLVSVVIPAHNSARWIQQTLTSVTGQRIEDLEVVVTDDGSNDGTTEILESWQDSDPRVRLLRHTTSLGPGPARNTSIAAARGRFVAFCDSDDLWLEDKLSQQIPFMKTHLAALSFTSYRIIDQFGRPTGQVVDAVGPESVGYEDMLRKRATMGCSTVVVDRKYVPVLRMSELPTGQDYATWLAILRQGFAAHRLGEPLTLYRITPGSVSRNKARKALRQWRIYRESERLPVHRALWYFGNYAYRAVFRR